MCYTLYSIYNLLYYCYHYHYYYYSFLSISFSFFGSFSYSFFLFLFNFVSFFLFFLILSLLLSLSLLSQASGSLLVQADPHLVQTGTGIEMDIFGYRSWSGYKGGYISAGLGASSFRPTLLYIVQILLLSLYKFKPFYYIVYNKFIYSWTYFLPNLVQTGTGIGHPFSRTSSEWKTFAGTKRRRSISQHPGTKSGRHPIRSGTCSNNMLITIQIT